MGSESGFGLRLKGRIKDECLDAAVAIFRPFAQHWKRQGKQRAKWFISMFMATEAIGKVVKDALAGMDARLLDGHLPGDLPLLVPGLVRN